jgi:hypothetical protein
MTTIKKAMKTMNENNTTSSTDDAAIVSMETHINKWDINKCRLLISTL